MKKFTLIIFTLLLTGFFHAEKYNPFVAVIHNTAFSFTKDFKKNDSLMKRTLESLTVLRKKISANSLKKTIRNIKNIKNIHKNYYSKTKKMEKFYKERWRRPRYTSMPLDWKKEKVAEHKEKITLLGSLSEDIKEIFNVWTKQYNKVKSAEKKEEIIEIIKKGEFILEKRTKKHETLQKEIYEKLKDELEIIKLMDSG